MSTALAIPPVDLRTETQAALECADLNRLLLNMNKFGEVMLYRGSLQWSCTVEVHSSLSGTKVQVRASGPAPAAAAHECARRLLALIEKGTP